MNNSVRVDIYNLLHLIIDKNNPWRDDIISSFGDVPKMTSPATAPINAKCPEVRINYRPKLSTDGLRRLDQDTSIGVEVIVNHKYGVRLEKSTNNNISVQVENAGLEVLIWIMQLCLLQSRTTFVHAVGIEKSGKALLFPSWGGVGKTAIAKGFVKDLGWKLLGDDLLILEETGVCYGYPKPMVLYPYHKNVFPHFFSQGKGPVSPTWLNATLTSVALKIKPFLRSSPALLQFARRHNPQSIRVNPSEVFGLEKLASTAKIQTVVWLDRVAGISKPMLFPAETSLPSRIFGSTLRELDAVGATMIHTACGLGIISANQLYTLWMEVLSAGLRHISGWILYIPADLPVQDTFTSVVDTLNEVIGDSF